MQFKAALRFLTHERTAGFPAIRSASCGVGGPMIRIPSSGFFLFAGAFSPFQPVIDRSGTALFRLIPLLCNGSSRSRLLISFRPFNSEVHSVSALLPGFHQKPPGSLKTALKRTRPRQRFYMKLVSIIGRMRGGVKE